MSQDEIEEIDPSQIEEVTENEIEKLKEKGYGVKQKEPNLMVKEPFGASLTSSLFGQFRAYRHKTIITIFDHASMTRQIAHDYEESIVCRDYRFIKKTMPITDYNGNKHFFAVKGNPFTFIPGHDFNRPGWLVENVESLKDKHYVADLARRTDRYEMASEINKAMKPGAMQMMVILLAVGLGVGIGMIVSEVISDPQSEITVNGDYVEDKNINDNNQNNNNQGNNGNNGGTVVID